MVWRRVGWKSEGLQLGKSVAAKVPETEDPVRMQPSRSESTRFGRARQGPASPGPADDVGLELGSPLGGALRWWQRRGYTVTYADPRLVQVTRSAAAPEQTSLLMLAGLLIVTSSIVFNLAMQRRIWHTVTLTIGPDGRVFTHRLRTRQPPQFE